MFPNVNKPEAQMRPDDYSLHAIRVNLSNAMIMDKVEMMEETLKVVSSDFIKKSHCLEKMKEKFIHLKEYLDHHRKGDKSRSVEINRL